MGVLYSLDVLDDETRAWFPPLPPRLARLATGVLPTDAELKASFARMARVTSEYSHNDADGGWLAQARLQRGDEHTSLNIYKTEDGRRRMYFEKGWFSLVFDCAAACAGAVGPLLVCGDDDGVPLLVPPSDTHADELSAAGFVSQAERFPSVGLLARIFRRDARTRERLMLVGKVPPAEIVHELKLVREAGFVYFLTQEGDVARIALRKSGEAPAPQETEVVVKLGLKRAAGYAYLIDGAGDIRRVKQR